ncbi:hypothetical protein [Catellatospora sp. IY07-71]|uniref:hypothetical protein n=1 Tax=Catellatospora sp. IY07-71 TaxID=2728827 RepID=UPI001BB32D7F|nr:hypothetical protein [Catellatospora sp. IY07-71]
MARTFHDEDAAFERWRDSHPDGFVVNHDPIPKASYVVLHRADCVRLRSSRGSNWTRTYGKTCAERLEDIEAWADATVATRDIHLCGFCQPPGLAD